MTFSRVLTAHVPESDYVAITALARANNISVHRLCQRVLSHAAKYGLPHAVITPADERMSRVTDGIGLSMPATLGERLVWTARQMRTAAGGPLPPSALARQILTHWLVAKSDVMDRIQASVDPKFVDPLGMMNAGGQEHAVKGGFFTMVVRVGIEDKETIKNIVERKRGTSDKFRSINALCVSVLNAALPHLPVQEAA